MRTKEELENLLNGSPLFAIDRTVDAELFVATERRFLNDLAELLSLIRKDFAEIGYEVIQTGRACIKAYKTGNGAFLNYFNAALKRTLLTVKAKEMADNARGGLTLDERTERTIRQILKLARVRGESINDEAFQKKTAGALGLTLEVVREAITINDGTRVISGNATVKNKDCEETELFEFIAATTDTAEGEVIKIDNAREFVVAIDIAYKSQQERMKPLLRKLLTAKLIETLQEVQLIQEIMRGLEFLDAEILSNYILNARVPTARDIAEEMKVLESSVSRTLKTFIGKIERMC